MASQHSKRILGSIIFIFATCAIATVCYLHFASTGHTVKDFGYFPYAIHQANEFVITNDTHEFTISRRSGEWKLTKPVEAELSDWGKSTAQRINMSHLFYDTKEPASLPNTSQEPDYREEAPRVTVQFFRDDNSIATLTIGSGKKTAEADSERRWIFVDQDPFAYRVFIPLFDFGDALRQPMSSWRNLMMRALDSEQVTEIHYKTSLDEISLDRNGETTADNPQGWRVASASGTGIAADALNHFKIDERRVATILDLVAPFYVDDFVDNVSWSTFDGAQTAASIQVVAGDDQMTLEIGKEIDFSVYPQFAVHGAGSRFVHLVGQESVGVMAARRMLGIMPSFNDLRTKKIWSLPTQFFSRIDVRVGGETISYKPHNTNDPNDSKAWIGIRSDDAGQPLELNEKHLIAFVKTLSRLEAVRFATAEEKDETLNAAEITVYLQNASEPTHRLLIGGAHGNVYRLAQADDSEVFVLSEPVVGLLTRPLTNEQ